MYVSGCCVWNISDKMVQIFENRLRLKPHYFGPVNNCNISSDEI